MLTQVAQGSEPPKPTLDGQRQQPHTAYSSAQSSPINVQYGGPNAAAGGRRQDFLYE